MGLADDSTSAPTPREAELQRRLDEIEAALAVLVRQRDAESSQLSATAARAAHADRIRLLGQFVGGIIHDFNNVLTVLHGAAYMLRRSGVTESQSRLLSDIDHAVDGATELSRHLLDFSRLDGTAPEPIALPDFFKATAALLSHLVDAEIELAIAVDEACWPVVATPSMLRAVVMNLTANAGDAMPQGGRLSIAARNCYSTERPAALAPGDYVQLSFTDTGCGMAPEVLARAGEAFYTTKAEGHGTGLGLASAFELAQQCCGRVMIASSPGVGTCINLYLPRAALDAAAVASSEPPIDPAQHGDATILLIEPELSVRQRLAELLKQLGYRAIAAERDEVALALVTAGLRPDLALIDLQRDQAAGAPLAARLRQASGKLPIIFLADSTAAHRLSGELIFRKPVNEAEIARAILQQLGRSPASIAAADAMRAADRLRDSIRNPLIGAVYQQWRDLGAALGRLPTPAEAALLSHALRDNYCLLQLEPDQAEPTFQFVSAGAALTQRLGRELAGERVTTSDLDVIGSLANAYRRALSGLAHFDYARIATAPDTMLLFERLILPLSDDGARVSHLAGVISFDEISRSSERISP